ncbi:MAG: hypothetical protein ACM30G_17550 [Micromonosporaceae bacterium]
MSVYDVGDQAQLRHEVRVNGTLTDATVAVAVTKPDGTLVTPAPTVSHPSTGVYTANVTVDTAGPWTYVWTMSGAVVDVAAGGFSAQNPATPTYITVDQLKRYAFPNTSATATADAVEDDLLADAIASVSREIDSYCGRRFYADTTATARIYRPTTADLVKVDDFWTTTGLIIATGDNGTYPTTLTTADYTLEPLNGIVDGVAGWPYYRIVSTNSSFTASRWPTVQVTARWGWASVPAPVAEACKILASETFKAKGAPFGVASFDQFGPIRVRDNPMAAKKLARYVLRPVLMA